MSEHELPNMQALRSVEEMLEAARRSVENVVQFPKAEAEEPQVRPQLPAVRPPDEPPKDTLLVIDPQASYDNAKEFAMRTCMRGRHTEVWHWGDQFWRWNGQYYVPYHKEEVRGHVYDFLDGAYRWAGQNEYRKFKPSKRHVDDLLDALRSCLALPNDCVPTMWLDGGDAAHEWITFKNGIVNVRTLELRPLTHRLWSHNGLGFDWDREAECPTWERFCEEVFPDDVESVMFLEEFMGYCMTGDTKFEKGAMLIGPRRSGKSTILYLIGLLVGEGAYVGLSFNDWLATPKSAQVLIGKRVLAFPDVRLKPGRFYGKTYDPGGIDHRSSELLLKITGRDKVSVGRMYDVAYEGYLPGKPIIISNEVPNFNDPTGVLITRWIKLMFRVSFADREDVNLRSKLTAELPGIAAYCLGAYQRACERGRFVQPASAADLERAVAAASDPFTAMAYECFVPDRAGVVVKKMAQLRFEEWCDTNGYPDLKRKVRDNKFHKDLVAIPDFAHVIDGGRPLIDGRQQYVWLGMRLKKRS
jgi:putative DNA primase/helicase